MDEKTEELRDIFLDATGEEAVTERQEETHGSLAESDETSPDERIHELIETMRERYTFETTLDADSLSRLVHGFYDGEDDEELAEALGESPDEIFTARMNLHLVRETDRETPVEFERLRSAVAEGADADALASEFGLSEADAERCHRVVEAEQEATRSNDRFRDEFAELLTDSELSSRLARDAREDGLEEATEDIETDVSF